MALANIDGFEHGLATAGTAGVYDTVGTTQSIVTTPVRTGARALRINPSAATGFASYNIASTYVAGVVYIRFNTSLPAATVNLLNASKTSDNPGIRFTVSTSQFQVNFAGASTVAGGPTLVADTWYRVDYEFDTSTATASVKAKVDGGTEFSTTKAITAGNMTAHTMGTTAAETLDVFYDDWVYSLTATDYPLAVTSVERLIPSSDGTHNTVGANQLERTATGTDITDATTDAYTLIDDAPLDTTPTDYVNDVGTDATTYVEVLFSDLAGGTDTPVGILAYGVDRDSTGTGTSAAHSDLLLSDNTAVSPSVRLSTDDPGVTVTTRQKLLTAPGGGWTRDNVNGLKARLGFGDGAPDVWFASLMLEVAMQPAAVEAPPGVVMVTWPFDPNAIRLPVF